MTKTLRTFCFASTLAATAGSITACAPTEGELIDLHGKQVQLTLIHTSDIHSRLFPYQYTPLLPDRNAGLQEGKGPYGGIARMAYVVNRERVRADRSMHINGGDVFQGAPVFNYFSGEAEMRALNAMGVDAMVVANHEFDRGAVNVYNQLRWATFPVLAANYRPDDPAVAGNSPLGAALRPYTIQNIRGLRVAVIGMGNLSTVTSIFELPSKLGIVPWKTRDIAQFYVDFLRPQSDLIVVVTHLGLEVDERMIHETEGIDVVLGGHNHIVVSPPKQVFDCGGIDAPEGTVDIPSGADGGTVHKRKCKPRRVLLLHSGAFAKFVGRLDLVVTDNPVDVEKAMGRPGAYDPGNKFEVVSHTQRIIPIDNDVAEDRVVASILEPYKQALRDVGTLDQLVGYAPADVRRIGPAGADSQLGNLIATSMWLRLGVQTDFSMTNSTGIRSDLPKGPVTLEQMFNVFPFDNAIAKMQLSGGEVFELFDYAARRSSARACDSQVQIAGAFIAFDCAGCNTAFRPDKLDPHEACAEQVFIGHRERSCRSDDDCEPNPDLKRNACDPVAHRCRAPVVKSRSYELATSDYLSTGGSGYTMLARNTTQFNTRVQQRDAVTDFVRIGKPCGWIQPKDGRRGGLAECSTDKECESVFGPGNSVCACPDAVEPAPEVEGNSLTCKSTTSCAGQGRCVLKACRDDVASFHDSDECIGAVGAAKDACKRKACVQSGEQCKILSCIDQSIGAVVDGRVLMLGR